MKMTNKIKSLEIKISKFLDSGLFGNYKSKFYGNGMEFAEHREYSFGENAKNIDWKASARVNKLQVKTYEEDRDLNILFVLDNSSSMNFGSSIRTKKDTLQEIFFTIAMSAYNNNDNIGALIFDDENIEFILHKKTKNNIYKILEKLETPLLIKEGLGVVQEIINRKIKNNLIFILTDKAEILDERLLKLINMQNEIIIINIFDEFENKLDIVNNKNNFFGNISLDNKNDFLNIDLSDKNKTDKYNNSREKKLSRLQFKLENNNIGYISLDNKSNLFKELVKFFNKK